MPTLIAYRFATDNQLPRLPYMTRLDAFILMGTVLFLFADRTNLHCFGFERTVSIFPIRAADFLILDDVGYRGWVAGFRHRSLIGHFERARRRLACDCEGLRVLIGRGNHPVKGIGTRAWLAGRSCR